jgi:hypothetical protein
MDKLSFKQRKLISLLERRDVVSKEAAFLGGVVSVFLHYSKNLAKKYVILREILFFPKCTEK